MRTPTLSCLAAILLAACQYSAESQIPEALNGCWQLNDPDIETGMTEILNINGMNMTARASWWGNDSRKLNVERIAKVDERSLEGLITFQDISGEAPYATELGIGIRGAPENRLVVVEGDAGSRWFARCS